MEQIGSGIIRIQELLSRHNLKEATFRTEGMFTIIFNRPIIEENAEKTREKIIGLISENKNVTINLLAEKTNVSLKTIEFHLSNLKKEVKIELLGADNGVYWVVKKGSKNK